MKLNNLSKSDKKEALKIEKKNTLWDWKKYFFYIVWTLF